MNQMKTRRSFTPQQKADAVRKHLTDKVPVRPACPKDVEDARRRIAAFVEVYNQVRLHGAIGYITPADKLHGLAQVIHDERDRKLEEARARRQQERRSGRAVA